MKLFLEKKEIIDGEESIVNVKEIKDIKEAVKGDVIHKCRHDETPQKACERVVI